MNASPVEARSLHSFLLRLQHAEHPCEDWEWLLGAIPNANAEETKYNIEQRQFMRELCPTAADGASLVHELCAAIGRKDTMLVALQVTGTLMGVQGSCWLCSGVWQPTRCWAVWLMFEL